MGQSLRIGRVFGVELRVDSSWFIVFVLIAWSLADHYFPQVHPSWSPITYWWMGILTSLVFFGTVFAHELAHGVASRARGIPVKDITLYIFGGATQMTEEPGKARDELLIAVVGPLTSLTIAGAFAVLWWLSPGFNEQAHALAGWLAQINLILGLSSLIPGFPLDGGRVLRAIVWGATGDPQRATAVAAGAGRVVAFGLIFLGIWQIFAGDWADGLWIAFIGWFLDSAATAIGQRETIQRLLTGHTVREAMVTDCPRLLPHLTLDVLVDQAVLPSGRWCFPVLEGDRLVGLLTLHWIKEVPRERWPATHVADVMIPLADLQTAKPDDDLAQVFERLVAEDVNQLPVVDNGRFIGMVARDTILNFLRTRTAAKSLQPSA